MFSQLVPNDGELWEVCWQTASDGVFPEFKVATPRSQGKSGTPPQVGGGTELDIC